MRDHQAVEINNISQGIRDMRDHKAVERARCEITMQ